MAGNIDSPNSMNRYPYVEANPINNVDPAGRCVLGLFGKCDNPVAPVVHTIADATLSGIAIGVAVGTCLETAGLTCAGAIAIAGGTTAFGLEDAFTHLDDYINGG
jgi:hypothetical protein